MERKEYKERIEQVRQAVLQDLTGLDTEKCILVADYLSDYLFFYHYISVQLFIFDKKRAALIKKLLIPKLYM